MTEPTAPAPDVTRDPYVLLMACLTFHKLPPELRKAIKECVDARPVAPVASEPAWFAVDTPGADFDVTFFKTLAEVRDFTSDEAVIVTPLYIHPPTSEPVASEPASEWNEKPLRDAISRLIDVERRHCIGKAAVFDIKQAQAEVDEAIQALKREPR